MTRALAIARRLTIPYLIYCNSYTDIGEMEAPGRIRRICKGCVDDIRRMNPSVLVMDTYPYGLYDEWRKFDGERIFVARRNRVKFDYDPGDFTHIADPQENYILIRQPEEWLSIGDAQKVIGADWPVLCFHAGCQQREQQILVEFAKGKADELGKRLVTFTPCLGRYPVCELLPAAGAVVCGAGYNAFAETKAWGGQTFYLPFKREFDDQIARLQEENPTDFTGAMEIARKIEEIAYGE